MARIPLYKMVETEMITRIETGTWEVGRRLANEFDLADEFNVSQGTMRRALIALEEMGYLSRKPGRGTLVAANARRMDGAVRAVDPVLHDSQGRPLKLDQFRARSGIRTPSDIETAFFGTVRIAYLDRTLKYAGNRAALEEISVPADLAPALDEDAATEFRAFLETHGLATAQLVVRAQAEMTDMALSVALSVDRHTALLRVATVAYDAENRAIGRQILRLAIPGAILSQA